MEFYREELFPFVSLTALRTDKFKTNSLSATVLTQLDRETAARNAILPYILFRGTKNLPDQQKLNSYLNGLYGASVYPLVRKRGEIQCVGFEADFCDDRFLPGEENILRKLTELIGDLLLDPVTRGGLLLPGYVDSEKEKMLDRINAEQNNKRVWARQRLIENMCAFEPYAVSRLGDAEGCEALRYATLSKDYKTLLSTSPIEFFYCGSREGAEVAELLHRAFLLLRRGEIDTELGTDVRMNAVEDRMRVFTEEMPVTQGNLAVGFRMGECMEEPDIPALRLFNSVYGGNANSKLFRNVRERLSLCYFASSEIDIHKGILTVNTGIDFKNYDAALAEILAQMEAMRRGEITEHELNAAKNSLANSLRHTADDPTKLEEYWLHQTILGLEYGPAEEAELLMDVTVDDLYEIAQGVTCDAVYFLRGEEEAE